VDETPYAALLEWRDESLRSAAAVVPHIVRFFRPRSVVDFGCGLGTWLSELADAGVDEVLGLDGPWVDTSALLIPPACFRPVNLVCPVTLTKRYDVALSLEVAEHLPESGADALVGSLVDAAPVVVFSAAIPGQGGVEHVNEQPPRYWAVKFAQHGYSAHDVLRPLIWDDDNIAYYYRQNMIVFMSGEARGAHPALPAGMPLECVHPVRFRRDLAPPPDPTLRELMHAFPKAVGRSVLWRLGRGSRAER
jgi:hypothetical protein